MSGASSDGRPELEPRDASGRAPVASGPRLCAGSRGGWPTIELVPLARATATLSPPLMLPNTPAGMRIIFEISDYRFEGERFAARQRGAAAADWLVVGPEGTATLDVRATLETHDGALVLLRYSGRVDASRGLGGAPIYAAPQFDTGDERYAWLNRLQAIARGTLSGSSLEYEIYEVR